MKLQELKDIVFESYLEVLKEQAVLQTGTQEVLGKFPTLRKAVVNLLTSQYEDFVKEIQWIAPKPTTFKVVLKNEEVFFMKWLGKGFEAQIGGKKYYLNSVDSFQQALDKLGEIMKYTAPPSNAPSEELPGLEGEPEIGGPEPEAGLEGEPTPPPGEEEEVEFEEPGEEPAA